MKIGIEIHQRLDTTKLFCQCPSVLSDKDAKPDATVTRKLHPVFSELGEIDQASRAEFSRDRSFEYQYFSENNCLVELDEEPPHELNGAALKIALEIASHLHAKPVDELHVMRKLVIDGSNTSGFQRTAVVALNGHIESSKGEIGVPLIAIEEESSGIVSTSDSRAVYRLDRLGIPLVEISTTPDIRDGAHLKEVAEKLGMILRATGKVARGLGTIRQDVNISTSGGARVELKGAQDLKMLSALVENEEKRQLELVKILTELRNRKALPLKKKTTDVSSVFRNTEAKLIRNGLNSGAIVLAQKLSEHRGILGHTTQPGKRYGTELSDYSRMAGVKGIIHSDENLEKYHISPDEQKELKKKMAMKENDAFVLVVAPKEQAEKAIDFVILRANMDYVPEETRRANPDGTSTFLRPLPGKARLYPETDVPPVQITEKLLASVEKGESLDQKKKKLEKLLNREMATTVLKSRHLHLFEKLVDEGIDPMLAATTLENTLVSLRREGVEFLHLETTVIDMFREYKKGTFVKAAIPEILRGMAKGARVDAVLKVFRLQKISGKELEKLAAKNEYDMKTIMAKHRLQVDPQEVAQIIKGKPKKVHKQYR